MQSGLDWGIEAYAGGNAVYNIILWLANYRNVQSTNDAALALGTTNHHVVTYQNSAYCLHLNGVLLTAANSFNVTIRPMLQIGTTGWPCGALNGVIGELRSTIGCRARAG